MTLAGLAFVGYAVAFLVLNFTGAFLELGIGPDQVDKGKAGLATVWHLGPVYLAVVIFLAGVVAAYSGMRTPR